MSKSLLGVAWGFVDRVNTRMLGYIKLRKMEETVIGLPEDVVWRLTDEFAQKLIDAAQALKNIFTINVDGNRTTEQVVAAGNYQFVNFWINGKNFPWRRRQGKNMIELVDMTQHGFSYTYSLADALVVLQKLGLGRPVYEDGLIFGEQHPDKQRERPIMFPHEPVLDVDDNRSVVYLWGDAGSRGLYLCLTGDGWRSGTLVAGVRKS